MQYKTFNARLRATLRESFNKRGLKLKDVRAAGKNHPIVKETIGMLLYTYPVSFHIDFIIDVLGFAVDRRKYRLEVMQAYSRSMQRQRA